MRGIPEPGSSAPLFALFGVESRDGGTHRAFYPLSAARGNPVILLFHPPGNTTGGARRLRACGHCLRHLADATTVLWAITPQHIDDTDLLARTHGPDLPLLADADHTVTAAYGLEPFGPGPSHGIVVIDASGTIRSTCVAHDTFPDPAAIAEALAALTPGTKLPRYPRPTRRCAPILVTARDVFGRPRPERERRSPDGS